jgi:hypothetical protein
MKTNEKKLSLIGYGLKPSLVMSLNESQIDQLHLRMVNKKKNVKEQVTQVPGKPSYKIGDKGGTIPNNPSGKGYALKQNPDKTTTAIPMDEKAVSQKQQEFFGVVRAMQKGKLPKKGKAGEAAKDMTKKDVKDFASTKHKGLPKKVETNEGGYMDMIGKASNKNMSNKIADIQPSLKWESILEDEFSQIIENTIFPKMTKKDFIKTLMESPTIAPDRERTKEKEKEKEKTPDKNDPFRPGKRIQPKPAPKAKHKKEMSEAPEVAPAPVKVPEREKEQTPDKNDPFRPGKRIQPKPAPKAKLPEWMSSESIGLK